MYMYEGALCMFSDTYIYIWHVYEHINVYGFVIYIYMCVCVHNIYICIDRPISPHIDKCTYTHSLCIVHV